VRDVDAQNVFEVPAAEDHQPVETLVADGADESLRVGVRSRRLHGRVDDLDAFAAQYLVERGGELAVAIVDQETHPLENIGEAEVARLLTDPRSGRVRRATGKMDTPAPELDEEHVLGELGPTATDEQPQNCGKGKVGEGTGASSDPPTAQRTGSGFDRPLRRSEVSGIRARVKLEKEDVTVQIERSQVRDRTSECRNGVLTPFT
jgi:hypothetical protein